ncbi:hypothetical protein ACWEO4_31600 [Streptomyces sp. NPDC004393]
MTSESLTVDTPAGTVRATADPRQDDAVVFQLDGAMRSSVHVTGTHHPHHRDQFTAVRACLGPVNAYQTTAPDDALPRLTRGRTRYHGSLTLSPSATTPTALMRFAARDLRLHSLLARVRHGRDRRYHSAGLLEVPSSFTTRPRLICTAQKPTQAPPVHRGACRALLSRLRPC